MPRISPRSWAGGNQSNPEKFGAREERRGFRPPIHLSQESTMPLTRIDAKPPVSLGMANVDGLPPSFFVLLHIANPDFNFLAVFE